MFKFKIIFLIPVSVKHFSAMHYACSLYILTLNCNERKEILLQNRFPFHVK